MTHEQINAIFHQAFNGQPNFITPDILKRGKRGRMVYEISSGEGFGGGTIYGVTVLELSGLRRQDLSACFSDLSEAECYVAGDFQKTGASQ